MFRTVIDEQSMEFPAVEQAAAAVAEADLERAVAVDPAVAAEPAEELAVAVAAGRVAAAVDLAVVLELRESSERLIDGAAGAASRRGVLAAAVAAAAGAVAIEDGRRAVERVAVPVPEPSSAAAGATAG
jgi:hypothetical protein